MRAVIRFNSAGVAIAHNGDKLRTPSMNAICYILYCYCRQYHLITQDIISCIAHRRLRMLHHVCYFFFQVAADAHNTFQVLCAALEK